MVLRLLVANPCESTLIASQKYSESYIESFKRILNTAGPKGFYTGVIPMTIKNGTFVSGILIHSTLLNGYKNFYHDQIKHLHRESKQFQNKPVNQSYFTNLYCDGYLLET